ncbi:putative ERG24-C-14 sterol reductase [Serendipita vermifera]|nr:putative ERG24-C-14 sterol reductase [Serendipita vermifera]
MTEHKLTKKSDNAELNPRTTHYSFGGPLGTLFVTIAAPFFTFVFSYACSEKAGGCPRDWFALLPEFVETVQDVNWWKAQWDPEGVAIYFAWYAFTVLAWAILPGDWVEGLPTRTGERVKYKINAFSTMLLALGITGGLIWSRGPASFTFIYNHWIGVLTGSFINSVVQATYFYLVSFRKGKLLALGANTGNHIHDWFLGRELNPHFGSFDVKYFNELRPGMILWGLVNISMACEQAVRRGGSITDSMWLVNIFQGLYIADALYLEPAIFSTMDITTDGFGFMLSVGDLLWVPFIYSLQARYLAWHPVELGPAWTAAIFVLNSLGYYIFRDSNLEKNNFRNGRNPKNLTYMQTKRGTKLITSGWWGMSRHPNYFGDWIMGLSWCLTTGFNTPVTYFYIIYFVILLTHRQIRDDYECSLKYGDDWKEYKKRVPYRIIPGVY